ncbi:hypothetical protein [Pantoea endophytica]|uniref:Uncharacterized protein n=1 Tax=Pantoea endophytica TaxID=92488 RepID=A0ABX4SXG3_9GAMM|nr:hypothetical protein [Pantoea endophytica]MRT27069.1 hypothetical protein [Enterobacteriaceae bacterium RIT697]PLR26318.1 hypothetical protein PZBJ_05895 [Pantoea endophytica]
MDIEVCDLAMDAVRSVMGQAVINMLDEGIPITNDSLVGYMAAMFEDEARSCVAELAMYLFGVSKH